MKLGYRAILGETVGLMAMVLLLGYLVQPTGPLLLNWQPHPFWAVILLISVRYANPWGVIAGALCAAVYLTGLYFHGQRFGEMLYLGNAQIVTPLMFVVVAALIGEVIHAHRAKNDYLARTGDQLRERLRESERKRSELEAAYRRIEGRFVGQADTLSSLFDSLRSLDGMEPREIAYALIPILQRFIGARVCSVWSGNEATGWRRIPESDTAPQTPPALALAALREKRVVTARDEFSANEEHLGKGVVAGVLQHGLTPEPDVVLVESMAFQEFNLKALKRMELILYWASRALERHALSTRAYGQHIFDEDVGLASEMFFRTNLFKDVAASRRRGGTSNLMALTPSGDLRPAVRRRLHVVLASCLRNMLRHSDTATCFRDTGVFVAHLPDTNLEQAAIVETKIRAAIDTFDIRPYVDNEPLRLRLQLLSVPLEGDPEKTLQEAVEMVREGEKA